jgi:hypothetical protein
MDNDVAGDRGAGTPRFDSAMVALNFRTWYCEGSFPQLAALPALDCLAGPDEYNS